MFRLLMALLEDRIEYSVKRAVSPLAPYLKRVASGLIFFALACVSLSLALLFSAMGLFFILADSLNVFAPPALWISLGAFLLALVFLASGLGRLKKPR